jgi:hypothetical protein
MKHILNSFCKWCWINNKFKIINWTWLCFVITFNKTTFDMHNLFDSLFTKFWFEFFYLKKTKNLNSWETLEYFKNTSSGRVRDFSNSSCVIFCCRIGFARCFCFSWYSLVNNFVGNRPFLDISIELKKTDKNIRK